MGNAVDHLIDLYEPIAPISLHKTFKNRVYLELRHKKVDLLNRQSADNKCLKVKQLS
jgi:hypothetical protein